MNKVLMGSHAIREYYPEFRKPKDKDYINELDQSKTKQVENYWYPFLEKLLSINTGGDVLDPDCMLTLKASHANWDIFWDKTMSDIMFLNRKGHKINVDVYKHLVKGWRTVHGRESAPLIGKTSKTFFEDAVKRKYVHDDIHKAIAYYDNPIFESILKHKDDSVMCCEYKFNNLTHEDQLKMCREEIYVTALERFIIPNDYQYSSGLAYMKSLKKFVTTMSSGWMSLFLIDNYQELLYNKDIDSHYVELFKQNKHNCRLNEN